MSWHESMSVWLAETCSSPEVTDPLLGGGEPFLGAIELAFLVLIAHLQRLNKEVGRASKTVRIRHSV